MSFNYGGGGGGGQQPQYASVDPYGQMNQQYQNGYNQQQIPQNGYPNQQNGQPQYQPQYQQYLDDYDDQEFDKTEEEIDEEMQRELAEDAPWKKIQQNTFTRWANEHLKLVNRRIEDLQLDFSDGLSIIALVEVLSHKKLPRHNRKPMFRSQKLENVSVALDFLENVERIRLVNIDSSHLVDGKLKLILGLIWTLILHYSITMPQWENENPDKDNKGKKATPKQKLMDWVKSRMPDDVPINNFTTDWNDGRAIGALVDSCAPGLYSGYNEPKVGMAKDAMDLAEKWLGVPQLIQPEEMTNPCVDELSMMTYLSQYPQAKLKAGAPLQPKTNVARVRCFGQGVEPLGNLVDAPTKFTIETVAAGNGDVEVAVINPRGQKEPNVEISKEIPSNVEFNNDKNQSYTVTYTPTMEGNYKIVVKFANQELAKSPYNVHVEGQVGDPNKVTAQGPGIEPTGVNVDVPTFFEVDASQAGKGPVEVVILDPSDAHKQLPVSVTPSGPGRYRCNYVAKEPGLHSVNVFFGGQPISGSPYGVKAAPSCDAKKCRAYGRGIQGKGIRVGDVADFSVITKDAGEGELKGSVKGPDGYDIPCRVNKINSTTYECGYNPTCVGPHEVACTYGGTHIPKSVFKVDVGPYKESNIRAYGPGLEGGVVGFPADFIVETNGETGSLGFSIEGPSQAKIDCNDNLDGSANVTYWPTAVGEYAVHILCDGEDIPNSPYMAWIEQKGNFDPTRVKAYGPGIEKDNPLAIHKPVEFTVDCREAGDAPLKVTITDSDYQKLDVTIKNNGNGTYTCRYTPIYPNRHTIFVTYGGVAIPKAPVRMWAVEPSNPNKVKVYGPGVEKGVKTNNPTQFTVDCQGAGNGDVSISITDPKNNDVPYDIDQKADEVLQVRYEPKSPGQYLVSVTFNNQEIPSSPIKVLIEPDVDVEKIQVTGIDSNPIVGEPTQFNILTEGALSPGAKITPNDIKVTVQPLTAGQSGGPPKKPSFEAFIEPTADGNNFIPKFSLPEAGPYQIKVEACDQLIKDFRVDAYEPINPSKVKASGPGLTHGTVDKPADFVIDTRGAGNGALNLTVEGPCEARIECKDNQDGTCHVSYLPTMAGPYNINILYQGVHIPGSPFQATVKSDLDIGSIRCYGPGIDPQGNFISSPTDFIVDASAITSTGTGKVACELTGPNGKRHLCPVQNNEDGTYTVQYVPNEAGQYSLDVTYENIPVPGSTFHTQGIPGCDPRRVKAYGPGLEGGMTNLPCQFTVETKGCGQGSLSLAVEGPSEAKMICKENQNGVCIMEYLPVKAGPYDITIKYADQHVPGSPYRVNIEDRVDSNAVHLKLPEKPFRVGTSSDVILDGHNAGRAQPRIDLTDSHGRAKPLSLKDIGEGQFVGTVIPNIEGPHELSAFWDGQPINNSPVTINVLPKFEPEKVRVDGPGVRNGVQASLPAQFTVDTREAGEASLEINIRDPEGNLVQPRIEDNSDGTFNVFYVPEDCGRYTINVLYGGQQVRNSPFNVKVDPCGDASRCFVSGAGLDPVIQIGEAYTITVDTREAGQGNVTCHIRAQNGNDLDIDIEDNNDGTFNIFYTPHNPGNYTIKIKFGGQNVPNGDVVVMAGDEPYLNQNTSKSSYNLQQSNTITQTTNSYTYETQNSSNLEPFNLRIPISDLTYNNSQQIKPVTARVKMPSGKVATPSVDQNPDGTVSIKYQPSEVGLHELDVFYNGQAIQGSPFKFHVDALNTLTGDQTHSGYVTAYGAGLSYGNCNESCEFKIVTKDAGTGGLAVAVEGPSKAEIQCRDNKNGTCDVVYYPTVPGDYTITVKFSDKHIVGSPFTAKVKDNDSMFKRNQVMYGNQSDISLKVIEGDVNDLQATIRSPSGHEEPCLLKKLSNGSLGISFTPREVGEHIVSVHRDGKHIKNSPFRIEVRQSEIGDASRVKLYGNGLDEGYANQVNEFYVNTKEAGYGGLSLSIEGPSKADIECHDNEDGSCRVTYKPTEPGMYLINVKFADKHVPGSPFSVNIGGAGRLTERITRERKAVDTTYIGSSCELSLKIPGTSAFDMAAYVTSPSGRVEDCEVADIDNCNYCIKFVPKEMGIHTVSVKNKEMHIPGSPFEFTVGAIAGGGTHKVRASGLGLVKAEVNYPADFNIYTREAGAGALAIAIEGPAKAEIDFHDHKDGTCGVSYVCPEPGEYQVSVKFNDEHIPESPFNVYVSEIGDARKLTIHSLQSKGLQVNKACTFSVNVNGAKGKLDAQVISPSGQMDNCLLQEIDSERYAIRFIPNENGMHLIHVRFNGHDVPESPFRVVVGQLTADPGRVFVSGSGINSGKTGEPCEFLIDTLNAGAGALAVTVDGPAKVQLDCKEVTEGYRVNFVPAAPGDYLITIKFVGVNIAGSPFKCRVTGQALNRMTTSCREHSNIVFETVEKSASASHLQSLQKNMTSDASRVKVRGPGLQKAFRNQKAQFVVDTKEAGNNMLMVGVYGPKIPCEEVVVKHIGNQQYQVTYCVKDKGDHMLIVKYGDQHIPGSPFEVSVV